ncbi:pyrroline-5-carboxylate reductase [Luteolibacter pohnpeiensis]|nr:pyrroline-5-carboxylate reductase [Luteolibacter pohnpeiensis]
MKLGLIGCGKMATALVKGAIQAGVVNPSEVVATSRSQASRDAFAAETGAKTSDLAGVLATSEVILLCPKPQDIPAALEQIRSVPQSGEGALIISIAAGVTAKTMEDGLPDQFRVIRSVPNTPSLVGCGAAAYCLGADATEDDAALAQRLLGAVGVALRVPEKLINAVTGVSGSGPAYVYLLIEALADGGVKAGLSRADAIQLSAQTFLGAATMVLETGEHPAVLKDKVASPAGTTIAALASLEKNGARSAMIQAVEAVVQRANELGGK